MSKKVLFTVVVSAWLMVHAGSAPVIRSIWHSGVVPDTGSLILNNCSLSSSGSLAMDGRDSEIAVKDSNLWNISGSYTFFCVFKIAPAAGSSPEDAGHDAFFYRHNQFFLGVIGNRIYFNFFDGRNWVGALYGNVEFRPDPERFYSLALTLNIHRDIAQGELWTGVEIYLDGVCVAQRKFDQLVPGASDAPVEIGCATGFGEVWHLGGEVGGVQIFRRILPENEIRRLVTADSRLTPGFQVAHEVPDVLTAALQNAGDPVLKSRLSAVCNFIMAGGKVDDALNMLAELQKNPSAVTQLGDGILEFIQIGESVLTLCRQPQAGIISWYDLTVMREMWNPGTPLWRMRMKQDDREQEYSAENFSGETELSGLIRNENQASFVFKYSAPWGNAEVAGAFDGKRIDMSLHTASNRGYLIDSVTFPAFGLRSFQNGIDNLLVPCMSGRVLKDAVKNRASFSSDYPRGYCSMQLGAYYDDAGGIYFSSEDPTGQLKTLNFLTDSGGLSVSYTFYPGWDAGSDHNEFTTSVCALELFRGNWYQAGKIYRRTLEKLQPVWWSREQPRRTVPQWMQNNLIWIRLEGQAVPDAVKLQSYIGEPLALHWYLWNGNTYDRDYPFFNLAPFTVEMLDMAHAAGMKVVPYLNGRIWEILDRRDEKFATESLGRPVFVIDKNGSPVLERGVVAYHLLCFATPAGRDILLNEMDKLINLGCDGVYLDQVAAAVPKRCYEPRHRHRLGAGDVWFQQGHRPLLETFRSRWQGREVILASEDNSEIYAGSIDGLLGWRWMYDGQVPLFMQVYSGRTHLMGIDYSNELGNGIYAKLATQLIWGEQLGWFMMSYITSPYQHNFRLFLRRTALCRKAMLDFFNRGMMLEVPQFTQSVPDIHARWGMHGTQYLHTPPVVSSRWKWNNIESFILANTTESIQKNCLKLDLPENARYKLYVFNGNGKFETLEPGIYREKSFELDPLQLMLILAVPENEDASITVENIRREFARIAESENIPDPFAPRMDYSAPGPVTPAGQWHDGTKALSVEGGRVEFQRNFVSHCNECVIDFGTIDFGETAPAEL